MNDPSQNDSSNPEENIFYEALEYAPGEERQGFLRDACAGDSQLRRAVDDLLKADAAAPSILNEESNGFPPRARAQELTDAAGKPGDMIGSYKLLQIIGEGGFGTVWMADRMDPLPGRVALKVIKLGMDTKEVMARFEVERQALAMMEHPNIAKVFDAGATESGRPYFVMELVRGIPITQFCDERKMSTRQRLELFIDVCSAVNHAHQKGIIHRDLKPSNVLVTLMEDKPVAKVIDFGIAKATQSKLTEITYFTRFENFVGTPAFMSPEQAKLSGLDIDTRSDIYSLGVLLYELLTGKPPFDPNTFREAGLEEIIGIITNKEPPKPSTRLATLDAEERIGVAGTHAADHGLRKLVPRDLDSIVMMAMAKERSRRYETANAFAGDIRRFLCNDLVIARPPSIRYRFEKFVHRNKGLVLSATAIMLALVAGTVISIFQALETKKALADLLIEEEKTAEIGFFVDETMEYTMLLKRLGAINPVFSDQKPLTLRFGLNASESPWEVYQDVKWILQPLRAELEQELRQPVRITIRVFRDYRQVIEAISSGEIDFLRCGSAAYILAKRKSDQRKKITGGSGILLLARHNYEDDPPGKVIVRSDLGVDSFEDLKGLMHNRGERLIVGFGSPSSGSARFRIQDALSVAGIDSGQVDWSYLKKHSRVAEAVWDGTAHVGGIKTSTFLDWFGETGIHPAQCRVIKEFVYERDGKPPTTGKGKPWVAREGLDRLQGAENGNVFEAIQNSLERLDLQHYVTFWKNRELEKYADDHRANPPTDWPLPIKKEYDDYFDLTRTVMKNSRRFFEPYVDELMSHSAIKQTGAKRSQVRDAFYELDLLLFDILILRSKYQFSTVAAVLGLEVSLVRAGYDEAIEELHSALATSEPSAGN